LAQNHCVSGWAAQTYPHRRVGLPGSGRGFCQLTHLASHLITGESLSISRNIPRAPGPCASPGCELKLALPSRAAVLGEQGKSAVFTVDGVEGTEHNGWDRVKPVA